MADKDTPDWVVHLITEVTGIKESFKQSFDELNKTINGLKKETRATLSSERNNIVLVGLKEGAEAGDPDRMVEGILRYILDLKVDDRVPEVERLRRMLRWNDRQAILKAAG